MLSRRGFIAVAAAGLAARAVQVGRGGDSLLHARLQKPTLSIEPGEHALKLSSDRDGLLVVPPQYRADTPAPLIVLLHGAGGRASRIVSMLSLASSHGVVVLAPESRGSTWDAIRGSFGADVAFLDRALDHTFARCAINQRKLAIGGFSDGATYALSIGLDNGSLFTHVVAFSPGFIATRRPQGKPRIFVSHGTADQILPIDSTSRRIVPQLEEAGYPVTYREFDGPHAVPEPIAQQAFAWFTKG